MPLVRMPEFNGHSAEAVVALGSVPPNDGVPGTAAGAHREAGEAFASFSEALEEINDSNHLTPAGRATKRMKAAQRGIESMETMDRAIARSEASLGEATAAIERALLQAVDPVEVRSWFPYWQAAEGGAAEKLQKAQQAIRDGDLALATALLRAPRVLQLIGDAERKELRAALAEAVAPRQAAKEVGLAQEIQLAKNAVRGLRGVYDQALRQAEEEARRFGSR